MHGRFHAIHSAGGPAGTGWMCPTPVQTPGEFAAALGQAILETKFRGHHAFIVIDHRNLLFHVQETPPARGKILGKLVERLVTQNQFFDEPAAHAHTELPGAKGLHRHLLALLPQSLVSGLDNACAENGLRLDALWPAAAVLSPRLKDLPAPASETIVLATTFGGDSMNLLLGRSDGKLLFSRTVSLGGAAQAERAPQEINRTLHYAQQQFGVLVNQLFISGHDSFNAIKTASIRAGLRIHETPETGGSATLVALAASLPPRAPLNFARATGRRAATIRVLAAAGLAAALAASAVTTLQMETRVRARENEARDAEARLRREAESLATATALQQKARHLQGIAAMIGSTNDPPVVELFARHLSSQIPPAMRLTDFSIAESTAGWTVSLKALVREGDADLVTWLETFEGDLEKGPFRVRITDSTFRKMVRGEPGSPLASGANPTLRTTEVPVFISGVIE